MKKYESPAVEVLAFSQMDIVTASNVEVDGSEVFNPNNALGWWEYFNQNN
jgi:hypothetical protein